jgi:hypothetical protein
MIGAIGFVIVLPFDGTIQHVAVDDSTGQIIADPRALTEWL